MNPVTAQIAAALIAAVYLLSHPARVYAVPAALVAGLELAMRFGWVTFGIKGVSLAVALAAVLVACGAVLVAKTEQKLHVAAATVITLIGAIQLLYALA